MYLAAFWFTPTIIIGLEPTGASGIKRYLSKKAAWTVTKREPNTAQRKKIILVGWQRDCNIRNV